MRQRERESETESERERQRDRKRETKRETDRETKRDREFKICPQNKWDTQEHTHPPFTPNFSSLNSFEIPVNSALTDFQTPKHNYKFVTLPPKKQTLQHKVKRQIQNCQVKNDQH